MFELVYEEQSHGYSGDLDCAVLSLYETREEAEAKRDFILSHFTEEQREKWANKSFYVEDHDEEHEKNVSEQELLRILKDDYRFKLNHYPIFNKKDALFYEE